MPRPIIENAGISIQNHQISPAGAKLLAAKATKTKPKPIKKLLAAFSMLGSRLP